MSTQPPAFIATPAPPIKTSPQCSRCGHTNANSQPPKISRRGLFRRALLSGASLFISTTLPHSARAAVEKKVENEEICKNCRGGGKVPCDLCSGTGFWRALAGNDPKQRYKGVVCPECEGVGTLTCPVCLGTGEGKIKGLLRRRRVEPGPGRILQSN